MQVMPFGMSQGYQMGGKLVFLLSKFKTLVCGKQFGSLEEQSKDSN